MSSSQEFGVLNLMFRGELGILIFQTHEAEVTFTELKPKKEMTPLSATQRMQHYTQHYVQ